MARDKTRAALDTDRPLNLSLLRLLEIDDDDEKHGATDNIHWAAAHQLAREIPNAKLIVLAGEGHHYLATNQAVAHRAIREFIKP